MQTTRFVPAALLLLAWTSPARAQTADDVIEKYLAASGGREALSRLTSRAANGTISLTSPVGELSGTIEIYAKKPNKSRTLIKLDLTSVGAGQMTSDQRFDGTNGYVMDSLQGNRAIEGGQLDAMRNGSFPTPLLNYKEMGTTIALGDREKVAGKEAFVLNLTPKAGPPMKVYIDATNFMLVKTAVTINVPQLGGDIEQTVEFSDYRNVDGITVPFTTKSTNPVQSVTAKMESVKHNVEIDDASFSKP